MTIELPKEIMDQAVSSVRRYFAENLDDEIGELKARLLVEYFLKEIGPAVHNQALFRAGGWLGERLADMDATLHEPEFTYWR